MTPAWTQTVLWHQPWNLRQEPGYGSCKHPYSHNTESCWTVFSLYSTKLTTVIVCNDLIDCMEHDLGLVDHHSYVGLRKRESGTSTKWSALDSPPSLGSHDWHHLAIYPYSIFVLWNRCYDERCCFPTDLNIQLLLLSIFVSLFIFWCTHSSRVIRANLNAVIGELFPFRNSVLILQVKGD